MARFERIRPQSFLVETTREALAAFGHAVPGSMVTVDSRFDVDDDTRFPLIVVIAGSSQATDMGVYGAASTIRGTWIVADRDPVTAETLANNLCDALVDWSRTGSRTAQGGISQITVTAEPVPYQGSDTADVYMYTMSATMVARQRGL